MKMKIIGLTGQSGAGKGAVSEILREEGFYVIDCDKVYHSLLVPPSECLDAIEAEFGADVIGGDGTLDRKKLGSIVFASADKLAKLNEITLGRVIEKCRAMIAAAGDDHVAAVLDAPTLIESGFADECDLTVAVTAGEETRTERIMKRDGISREEALERIKAQKSEDFYTSRADRLIENNGDLEALRRRTEDLIKFFREKKS